MLSERTIISLVFSNSLNDFAIHAPPPCRQLAPLCSNLASLSPASHRRTMGSGASAEKDPEPTLKEEDLTAEEKARVAAAVKEATNATRWIDGGWTAG